MIKADSSSDLKPHFFWHLPHPDDQHNTPATYLDLRLPDTQVAQDIFSSAQDGIKLLRALELLDKLAHARLGQGATAKDLHGVIANLAGEARGLHLEERNLTSEVARLFLVGLE